MRKGLFIVLILLPQLMMGQQRLYDHRGVQYATHGKDFWVCFPRTLGGLTNNQSCLYFMAEHDCTVTISNDYFNYHEVRQIYGRYTVNARIDTLNLVRLPANVVRFADLLEEGVAPEDQIVASPQPRALHITSTDTISLILLCYALGAVDATNILPTEMLRDEYIVQMYPDRQVDAIGPNHGMFQVIATEDSTVVDITLSDMDWLGRRKDSVVTVTMDRGMLYNVKVGSLSEKYPQCYPESPDLPPECSADSHFFVRPPIQFENIPSYYDSMRVDLSGTHIKARDHKRIAVFQGNQHAHVGDVGDMGNYYGWGDFSYEQVMPIRYAGKEFVIPNIIASQKDFIQFTGLVDGTTITIVDPTRATSWYRTLSLDARETKWFLQDSAEGPFWVTSNHPILTSVHAMGGMGTWNERGDPATLVVVPVEWWHKGPAHGAPVYWIDDDNNGWIFYHSTHVFVRTSAVSGMRCDQFRIDTLFRPINGTPYSYAYIHYFSPYNSRQVHHFENLHGSPFWVVADAERPQQHMLFSYSHIQVGQNYLEVNDIPADSLPPDSIWCLYDPIRFHGWVERPADSIIWDFGDGNVERYLYDNGQYVTHTFADTGCYTVARIIKYSDEAADTSWGYQCCKSVFTRPPDTMYAQIHLHNHYDSAFSVRQCEGSFFFRGYELASTDTFYITTYWTDSGCDTLWKIDFVTCPHCTSHTDTVYDDQLPWRFASHSFDHQGEFPLHIDIGEECDSVINYRLVVLHRHVDTIFISAPNIISPNGDIEINRRFRLFCSNDIEKAEVVVFDRMGRRVAQFDGLTGDWDGTSNGIVCPQGTYVYKVRYIDGSNRNWKTMHGTVTIIR